MPAEVRVVRRPVLRLLEPWRTRALWASLAVNLFAASLLAASHFRHAAPPGPPGFDTLVERLARPLPAPDQVRFRDAMARERPVLEAARSDIGSRRAVLADAIAADPFRTDAARAAFAAFQDALRRSSSTFDAALLGVLGDLSPAGRAALADSMRHRRP